MTILSSLFETVGEQLDRIIAAYKREGSVIPPEPTIRNRPSGYFELDINIDENRYIFEMDEDGNIKYVNEDIYEEEGRAFKRIDSLERMEEISSEDICSEVERMFNQYDNVGVFSNYPVDEPGAYEEEVFFGDLVVLIAYNSDSGMVKEILVFNNGENISFVYGDTTTEFDNAVGILTFEDDNGYISFRQDSLELRGYNP